MQSRIRLLGLERLGGVEIYAPGLSEPEGHGATLHILADQLTLSQQGQIMPATLLLASPSQNFRPSYGLGSQCIFLPSDYNLLLLFYVSYEKQDTFPCALRSFRLWSFGLSCKKIDTFFLLFIFNCSKSAYFN